MKERGEVLITPDYLESDSTCSTYQYLLYTLQVKAVKDDKDMSALDTEDTTYW